MSVPREYHIDPEIKFQPLEVIDIPAVIASCRERWQNKTLCRVNSSVVRLGVIQGEFHWHKHEDGDEFFFVLEGRLSIDLEGKTVSLEPRQGFTVPRGVLHRTRAPQRTAIMMVERETIKPTGD